MYSGPLLYMYGTVLYCTPQLKLVYPCLCPRYYYSMSSMAWALGPAAAAAARSLVWRVEPHTPRSSALTVTERVSHAQVQCSHSHRQAARSGACGGPRCAGVTPRRHGHPPSPSIASPPVDHIARAKASFPPATRTLALPCPYRASPDNPARVFDRPRAHSQQI